MKAKFELCRGSPRTNYGVAEARLNAVDGMYVESS